MEKDKTLNDLLNKIDPEEVQIDILRVKVAEKIHKFVKQTGKSKEEVASIMGVHQSILSRWIGGAANWEFKTLAKLQLRLGLKIFDLGSSKQPKYSLTFKVMYAEINKDFLWSLPEKKSQYQFKTH